MNKIILACILLFLNVSVNLNSQSRIKMTKERSGIYTIPCEVNGLKLRFVFDTGASNVCISLTEVLFMLKNGYLDESDFGGTSHARIADGSVVENMELNLRELKIGNKVLKNVNATVITKIEAPLLLGQSAIEQLGTIKITGDELVITTPRKKKDANQTSTTTKSRKTTSTPKTSTRTSQRQKKTTQSSGNVSIAQVKEWIEKAEDYRKNEDYERAEYYYLMAYKAKPDAFNLFDYFFMGTVLRETNENETALAFFDYVILQLTHESNSFIAEYDKELWIRLIAGSYASQMKIYNDQKDYDVIIEKGNELIKILTKNTSTEQLESVYTLMAYAYSDRGDMRKSVELWTLAIDACIKENYGNQTLSQLERKGVQDESIGKRLYYIALEFDHIGDNTQYVSYLKRAAKFGNKNAQKALNQRSNNSHSNNSKRRNTSSKSVKRHSVGNINFEIPNTSDWDVSQDGKYITVLNKKNGLGFVLTFFNESLTPDLLTSLFTLFFNQKYDNFAVKKTTKGLFGGSRIYVEFKDLSNKIGIVDAFENDGETYIIMSIQDDNTLSKEFENIYKSIRFK